MAISINWVTKEIFIPKLDTQLVQSVPQEIRQLDIDTFRLELKDIEDGEGMPFATTHNHNTTITVGGVTLARVIEIINGYTITFEDGQYAVNLVGANSNIADVTNVNQVSVRSSNSAGLTYSEAINNQSYNGYVSIDMLNGTAGSLYPKGTPTDPVNNIIEALSIAESRNINTFNLYGTLILSPINNIERTNWFAVSPVTSTLVLSGQSTLNCTFQKLILTGTLNGRISADHCALGSLVNVSGIFNQCGFNGNINIDPNIPLVSLFNSCFSLTSTIKPIVNCNNITQDVHFRSYTGDLHISNLNTNKIISLDITSGNIEIDSSCTNGTIILRGSVSELIDNSGSACNVIDLRNNSVLLNTNVNNHQGVDSVGETMLIARLQAALAAALSA